MGSTPAIPMGYAQFESSLEDANKKAYAERIAKGKVAAEANLLKGQKDSVLGQELIKRGLPAVADKEANAKTLADNDAKIKADAEAKANAEADAKAKEDAIKQIEADLAALATDAPTAEATDASAPSA